MSEGRLAGKVAIVTGATSGIGEVGAKRFAAEDAKVVVAGRNEVAGRRVVEDIAGAGGTAIFAAVDVGDPVSVEQLIARAVQEFGRLDVIYSNAGLHEWGTAVETSIESWQRTLDVNLSGQFYLAKYAIPHLAEVGGGSIILTSSDYGMTGARRSVAYCAAKGALINLTRALALDSGKEGVRVNCLVPGPIATGRILEVLAEDPAFEEAQTRASMLGRLGRPEEVAAMAVFLASDESTFVTGSTHVVDGGVTAWYGV